MSSAGDKTFMGSETRLWELVQQRLREPSNTEAIDKRIWDLFGECWCIMFTDLSGFSRRVEEFGIIHFLQIIQEQKELLLPIVSRHDGILIKIEADSFLIIFRNPHRALDCAVAMQQACQKLSLDRADEQKILLCLGLGVGDILRIGDVDVYGSEVNAASKLGEDTAQANEILASKNFHDAVQDYVNISFEPLNQKIPGTSQAYRIGYQMYRG